MRARANGGGSSRGAPRCAAGEIEPAKEGQEILARSARAARHKGARLPRT